MCSQPVGATPLAFYRLVFVSQRYVEFGEVPESTLDFLGADLLRDEANALLVEHEAKMVDVTPEDG